MTLHFSHIGLTDGLTFMIPFGACSGDRALVTFKDLAEVKAQEAAFIALVRRWVRA